MGICRVKFALAILATCAAGAVAQEVRQASVADCTFSADPDRFLSQQGRIRREISDRVAKFHRTYAGTGLVFADSAGPEALTRGEAATDIPQRNFIDAEIFGKLKKLGVAPAPLTTDEEFFRRINLDLTGRIPSADDVRAFLADSNPGKRDAVIDRLLYSDEFVDRWKMWLGDLMQVTSASTNIARQQQGRDSFNAWIFQSLMDVKPLKDLAYEAVSASGNTYKDAEGAANFPLNASTPMGPIQDNYDTMLARTASTFLGMAYYDCLLCHNGRGHLDQISLWGSKVTRTDAEQMAAFFSRLRLPRRPIAQNVEMPGSWDVYDQMPGGGYDLNTNYGNRPIRAPIGTLRSLTPQYRLGDKPPTAGDNWREAFAASMVKDPMFARNIVNRLWKQLFSLGLVDPVDTMDPKRLDPANPPPAPWQLQATHPELLEKLAAQFVGMNYGLREMLRFMVQSSAYQLSSRYSGEWKIDYVPLFARHYPRRLEGEEVHDAIAKATGVLGSYVVYGDKTPPVSWAMQLPEPAEPRSNGAVAAFLNSFLRGNRDNQQRSQAGSILQQLALMNDPFVLNRTKVSASPTLQSIAKISSDDAAAQEIFLTFLSRNPSDSERQRAAALLKGASGAARNAAIEDLAWAAINKLDFLFSY